VAKNVYVDCTQNLERRLLERRLDEHNKGLVENTRNRRPFILLHSGKYSTLGLARKREDYLKSLYGSRERKRIMKECLDKNPSK
jgi:predicted GIY-YIG superfamily endonuclease